MLGKLTHWLSAKLELEDKEDDSLRLRFDALTHMKKVTLDVVQTARERLLTETAAAADAADGSEKAVDVILTEADACVHEYCAALESCLKLGLRTQSDQTLTLWNVLYSSSLVVDEPDLVQSIQTAALLSSSDDGKARCWLKLALNNHSLESTLLLIFSVQCDQVIRSSYDERALMRCCEGMGLFLQMVMDTRSVRFAITVNDDPFVTAEPKENPTVPIVAGAGAAAADAASDGKPVVATVADSGSGATLPATAADAVATTMGPVPPPPPSSSASDSAAGEDEYVEVSSVFFPHRHKGIKPWQHVFGVALPYLAKNAYHSRFALVDPALALPNLVQDCIDFLLEHASAPRLFRTTVVNVHLNQLREIVETDGALPLDLDAPGAGALLMDFFKNLPEPLLTADKYDAFVASGQIKDEDASVRNITCLVHDLPMCYKVALEKVIALMHFLVAPEHAQHNGLDVATAATTLAPALAFKNEPLRGPSGQRRSHHSQYQDVRYAAVGAQVIERMIQHYDVIFQDVRVQVSDALSRLEAKKDALLSIHQLFKMKPQVNFMSDKQYLEDITKVFTENAQQLDTSSRAARTEYAYTNGFFTSCSAPVRKAASPARHRVSMPEMSAQDAVAQLSADERANAATAATAATQAEDLLGLGPANNESRTASGTSTSAPANFRTASGTSTHIGVGARRQTVTTSTPFQQMAHISANGLAGSLNATFDRSVVEVWEKHGFNRPTILGNFEKGGVLLLRAVAYMVKTDTDVLPLLYKRALPSDMPTYDAGLVSAAISESLINLLKLAPSPEHPSINVVALSVEPFWELFDEEMYFYKLFSLMFRMFDQLWSSLDPEEASFTRVFCDTEAKLDELLRASPSSVEDVRREWEEMWKLLTNPPGDEEGGGGSTEDEASSTLPLAGAPPSPPRINKKPSFTFQPEEYATKLLNPSNILTLEHVARLDSAVPITCQLCRWCLLYSSEANGSSLHTLLMLSRGQSPTLLVIKDDLGHVFGGFASDEWRRATQYYGNGETFLFTFGHRGQGPHSSSGGGTGGFTKFPWSRRNNYFQLCSEESLVMGGGGSFGLFLDYDLSSGSTGACETFSSRPLVSSQEFSCVHVEVWGFTTSDKPLKQREPHKKSVLD
ncbi:hypothetical protein PybrP1_006243 [[Pythium] brassicae (nom. inval.)]|nr:hypothetical protein PybrP1_006243 [[Pythium] brassicae (nom. inval.)]